MILRIAALPLVILTTTAVMAVAMPSGLQSAFRNLDEIAQSIGFPKYADVTSEKTVKIAILDNGFHDFRKALGKTIPASTAYHAGSIPVDPKDEEIHGTIMAQTVAGLLAQTPNVKYELHLYSTFGFTNLQEAVKNVIAQNFDVVLYSQVWEYGGNGDGKGFINSLISQATRAGIIWVNASGNFADSTFRSAVQPGEDDWAQLPGPNNSVQLRCLANPAGKCPVRIVLSWNDFKDDVNEGTNKDLDLVLSDDTLNIIQTSGLKQMPKIPEGTIGASLYPREIIQAEVPVGVYLIRVKVRSHNFDPKIDELRITTSGDFTQMIGATRGETLLSPADNATVITVGASDFDKSSFSRSSHKPELSLPSLLVLKNGDEYKGSSDSAAVTAAAVVVLKSTHPGLTRKSAIAYLARGGSAIPASEVGLGLPLDILKFGPANGGDCFNSVTLPSLKGVPAEVRKLIQKNGIAVETTAGVKIFTQEDPFNVFGEVLVSPKGLPLNLSSEDDMIVVSRNGFDIYPRSTQELMPVETFEIVQQPAEQSVCKSKDPKKGPDLPSRKSPPPSIELPEVGK